MTDTLIVGILSLAGTLIGSIAGILTANKLTNYRIDQLEKKVEKHNNIIERTYILEDKVKAAHHRIDELREAIKV